MWRKDSRRRRGYGHGKRSAAALLVTVAGLWLWTERAERKIHYSPDYPREDLAPYLEADALTPEAYELLYRQTGLSQVAVDTLRGENRQEELLLAQEHLFADVETECSCSFLLFHETQRNISADGTMIPVVEDGDILITFGSHFLGWRNGHAGIVVDADEGLTLEALTLGKDSDILTLESWAQRPSFAVLRLRDASAEERAQIALYAREHLAQIPYRLTAGIWRPELSDAQPRLTVSIGAEEASRQPEVGAEEASGQSEDGADGARGREAELRGTQCAHLVWYAYRQFGYDLDSDGGSLVTPRDLYDSPLLEVVQIYGMEIN